MQWPGPTDSAVVRGLTRTHIGSHSSSSNPPRTLLQTPRSNRTCDMFGRLLRCPMTSGLALASLAGALVGSGRCWLPRKSLGQESSNVFVASSSFAAGCWLLAAGCCCCGCWPLAAGCWLAGCLLSLSLPLPLSLSLSLSLSLFLVVTRPYCSGQRVNHLGARLERA